MRLAALPVHPGLADRSRVSSSIGLLSTDRSALLILLTTGALAAASMVCLDTRLGIPGSAILRGIFPLAIGLALAPRRRAGTVMAMSAVTSAYLFHFAGGFKLGTGSFTSLALIGPCLDLCLRRVDNGWRLYGSFVLAGFSCNLLALTTRAATKFGGWDALSTRPFATWWLQAIGSYTACGIIAGLVSALVWFRLSATDHAGERAAESAE